jgi:hypothetical protein
LGNQRPEPDAVEVALAEAIHRAAKAEQWSTVEVLTNELRARRDSRAGAIDLAAERVKRGRS